MLRRRNKRGGDASDVGEGGPRGGRWPDEGSEAAGEGGHGEEVLRADGVLGLETDQLRKQNKRRLSSSYSNIQRFSAIL